MTISTASRFSLATAAALIALASASFSVGASAAEAGADQPDRCYGVNNCKGESLCATARNDCKGLNSCKGQGVVVKTKAECLKAGGTYTEPK